MVDITTICADIRNYFLGDTPEQRIIKGEFTVSNGSLTPSDFLLEGQYFRIYGSKLNEGVWLNTVEGLGNLRDETFTGTVWSMSVPKDFIELCERIDAWRALNEAANSPNMSTLSSENFGNYGYSKGSGGGSKSGVSGAALTWQTAFYDALTPYRRISVL